MVLWPGDAVSDERLDGSGIGRGKARVALPEEQVLMATGKGHAEDRVERVTAVVSEHADREGDSIRRCCSQRRSDRCPKPLPNGEHLVEIETVEHVAEVVDVGTNTERWRLPPGRSSAAQVNRNHGHLGGKSTHDQIPGSSVGQPIVHQQHCAGVVLDRPATPHNDIVSVATNTNS